MSTNNSDFNPKIADFTIYQMNIYNKFNCKHSVNSTGGARRHLLLTEYMILLFSLKKRFVSAERIRYGVGRWRLGP